MARGANLESLGTGPISTLDRGGSASHPGQPVTTPTCICVLVRVPLVARLSTSTLHLCSSVRVQPCLLPAQKQGIFTSRLHVRAGTPVPMSGPYMHLTHLHEVCILRVKDVRVIIIPGWRRTVSRGPAIRITLAESLAPGLLMTQREAVWAHLPLFTASFLDSHVSSIACLDAQSAATKPPTAWRLTFLVRVCSAPLRYWSLRSKCEE